jgi:D-lactate dehydrogenase
MTVLKVAFFDTKPYDVEVFNSVNKNFGFEIKYFPMHLRPETVVMANGFDVVCVFVNDILSAEVIAALEPSTIKLIALRCAGYNNVDLKAAYGKMHVVRVPAYSPHAIAEHTVGLMLSLNRKLHKAYARTRDSNFSLNGLLGFDMYGKTAGIIGTGQIGKIVAGILNGFGLNVLAYDKYPDQVFASANKITYTDIDTVFTSSDIITLHCPLTPENKHIVNAAAIAKMKRGVMIINTGRGELIDTKALIAGLKTGAIGYAGLDVYEEETDYFFEDFSNSVMADDVLARLLTFPNVMVTSHQAFFTSDALTNIANTTLNNIKAYFENAELKNEICYKCDIVPCRKKKDGKCF